MIEQASQARADESFLQQVRDVLAHLYDHVALTGHPLMRALPPQSGEASDQVRALRLLVMEAVEELRPEAGTPASDLAWRPYQVVRSRYLLGKDFDSIANELSLSVRQVQRELRRGVAAVGQSLWEKRPVPTALTNDPGDDLEREISRLAGNAGPVELRQSLASATAAVTPLAQRRGVELRGFEDVDVTVLGDGPLLRQLLLAALSSVIQSLDGGTVGVKAEAIGNDVLLTVSGSGIPSTRPAVEAQALGDAAGDLATLAQAQQVRLERDPTATPEALRLWLPLERQRDVTVAMVEDNPSVVALFARYLAGHGYRLVAIEDSPLPTEQAGLPVISRLLEIGPDVVILDVMMRNVDGWEVLQALRAQPALRDTPVVVCTVLNDPALALAIGADAYLHKPVMPAQLLECLARVLAANPQGERRRSGQVAP